MRPPADGPGALRAAWALTAESIRRSPRLFALSMVGATSFALLTVALAWSLGRVVDRVVVPVFAGRDVEGTAVAGAVALYVAVAAGRALSVIVRRSYAARWQQAVATSHRVDVVGRLVDQPLAWMRRRHTGDLLAASDNDPDAIVQFLAPLPFSLGSIVLVAVSAAWLLAVDPLLGLIAVVVIPLISVANIVFVRRADAPAGRIQAAVADLSDVVHETVDGMAVVKVLGAADERRRVTGSRIDALRRAKLAQLRLQVVFDTALELIPAALSILLILVGAHRAARGAVSVGEVVSVVQLFERLIWPLRMLAFAAAALPRSTAGRARIAAVAGAPLERLPLPGPVASPDAVIELQGVSVVHEDGRVALDGIDLGIRRGSRVAVVGPTGSGKTTLLHVLAGIDAPTAGTVHRADDATATLVFQEPLLFSGTLRHNVALGAPIGDDALARALQASSAAPFVGALDRGLDTTVGERGVTLSGGQRQRIALARALARTPQVLLLDDTTSALDPTTEADVLAALRDPSLAGTVVMVAARPSAIALADEIVVLDAGRIIDRGTHEELVARCLPYREIVSAYAVGRTDGGDGHGG
jgi:ABC-type multidrug transport system fused ATPase/permease subunit